MGVAEDEPVQLSGCKNGSCPKVFLRGDRAAVQGERETARTRAVPTRPGQVVVEIPAEVHREALARLRSMIALVGTGGAPDGSNAWWIDGALIVRGDADTNLTRMIRPGAGEGVADVSLAALVSAERTGEAA